MVKYTLLIVVATLDFVLYWIWSTSPQLTHIESEFTHDDHHLIMLWLRSTRDLIPRLLFRGVSVVNNVPLSNSDSLPGTPSNLSQTWPWLVLEDSVACRDEKCNKLWSRSAMTSSAAGSFIGARSRPVLDEICQHRCDWSCSGNDNNQCRVGFSGSSSPPPQIICLLLKTHSQILIRSHFYPILSVNK